MKRFFWLLLWVVAPGVASALTIVPTTEPFDLRASDVRQVTERTCASLGVATSELNGWRKLDREGWVRPIGATVVCEPHLDNAEYSLSLIFSCDKRGRRWTCTPEFQNLRIRFLQTGPHVVRMQYMPVETALEALRCLESDLRRHPELLNGLAVESVQSLWKTGDQGLAETEMLLGKECYYFTAPMHCAVDVPRDRPALRTGCFEW